MSQSLQYLNVDLKSYIHITFFMSSKAMWWSLSFAEVVLSHFSELGKL